jgi:hypothetical protein
MRNHAPRRGALKLLENPSKSGELSQLALNIRSAAAAQKLGSEAFRERIGLSMGVFYGLLRGEPPKTLRVLRKLQKAKVAIPPEYRISA